MVNGNATAMLALTSLHELSDVAASFNRIATAMLTANALRAAVVENAIAGTPTLDAAGHIQSLNPAAEALCAVTAAECVGQPISTLLPEYARMDRHNQTAI